MIVSITERRNTITVLAAKRERARQAADVPEVARLTRTINMHLDSLLRVSEPRPARHLRLVPAGAPALLATSDGPLYPDAA